LVLIVSLIRGQQAHQAISWPPFTVLHILAIGAAAVAALAPTPAGIVERVYSTGLYAVMQPRVTGATNLIPVSLLDFSIGVVCFGWLYATVGDFRRRGGWLRVATRLVLRTAALAAWLYLAFLAVWGLNYRRVPLASKLQFDSGAVSSDATRALAIRAIDRVNASYEAAHRDRADTVTAIDGRLADAFADVQRDLGARRLARPGVPKRTLLDLYFRRAAVDGMTDPYFLETLVARDLLPIEQPIVVAHEWSHLAGYADESEANFVGWLTCIRAGDDASYSGWLFLYGEIVAALGVADRRSLPELAPGPRADRRAIADRVRRNVSPRLSTAGWIVYDRYLKANRVEAGAASYAEVVRLVIGTRFGAEWSGVAGRK
jgi:Protein of unknown function (DUF3810)